MELALECAKHGTGDSERGLLFNAAHHHAEVLGLEDDTDTQGVNCALNGFGDLASETLLHLEATGEDIDEACHLAEADDFALGQVGDVRAAEEGQHMVLAERVELNVADNDHLVIVNVEKGFL